MVARIVFTVPDEPPAELVATADLPESDFSEALFRATYEYFVAIDRPQTAMLPRNVVARTIVEEIEAVCQTMLTFPQFDLEAQRKKFVRCCYRQVWRILLREWQARLLCAVGKSPGETRLPASREPVLEVSL